MTGTDGLSRVLFPASELRPGFVVCYATDPHGTVSHVRQYVERTSCDGHPARARFIDGYHEIWTMPADATLDAIWIPESDRTRLGEAMIGYRTSTLSTPVEDRVPPAVESLAARLVERGAVTRLRGVLHEWPLRTGTPPPAHHPRWLLMFMRRRTQLVAATLDTRVAQGEVAIEHAFADVLDPQGDSLDQRWLDLSAGHHRRLGYDELAELIWDAPLAEGRWDTPDPLLAPAPTDMSDRPSDRTSF